MSFIEEFTALPLIAILGPSGVWIACIILWIKNKNWVTFLMFISESILLFISILFRFFTEEIVNYIINTNSGDPTNILNMFSFVSIVFSFIFGALFILFSVRSKGMRDAP